ncbi:DHS-like NAD/FAD-binding domain-containing protein [Ilyonectria sp. MPI-CAGE-AT-0026]|nr:DHS-like NAD/FAD-binding domain-containing protein [Ilyonectria sp. MPI-CAGE-AT-0026]
MNMDHNLSSVRGLILEIGPGYHATMILPKTKTADLEKLKKFMNVNHELLRSCIVQLTSEFRVVLPERKDDDDVVTIQTLMEGNSVEESWQMAIQGSSSLMMKICRRLRNEDESARNAIICHARGKEMGFLWTCEQSYGRNILPGGCRQFQDNFDGACSACILQGHQRLCSARVPIVEEENYYQPSEDSNGEDQYRTTEKKRKRIFRTSLVFLLPELVYQSPSRLEYLNPFLPPLPLSSFLVLIHQSSLVSTLPNHFTARPARHPTERPSTSNDRPPVTLASDITPAMASERQSQLDYVDLKGGWLQVPIENDQLRPYITTNIQANASVFPPRRLTCFHFSNDLLGKLAKRADAVNAFLAYSRGQLALAPCTECHESYSRDGSAMPFPDCVFLPTYWGFACASCIARHRAVECSFNIFCTEYLDRFWKKVPVMIHNLSQVALRWLERGHPLSAFDPHHPQTIWQCRRHSGSDLAHELARPSQEPTFVFPPDIPNVRLPDHAPDVSASSLSHLGDLNLLNKKLHTKKNIIIISGAGVSTNAGSMSCSHSTVSSPSKLNSTVPDYRSFSRSKKSSRNVYDVSAYSTPELADTLHADVLQKLRSGRKAMFTPFDAFAERLAQSDHLRYHYTQNIDCRQTRLTYLSQRTMWLHGRADTLVCHLRPSHTIQVTPQSFPRWVLAPCPLCKKEQRKRAMARKRKRAVGFLRPNVLLYGENCPGEEEITAAFNRDLTQPVDAVLIVGTRLSIPSLANFTERLCKVVRANNPDNLVIWVSKESSTLGGGFQSLINFEYLGDCDDFASTMSG